MEIENTEILLVLLVLICLIFLVQNCNQELKILGKLFLTHFGKLGVIVIHNLKFIKKCQNKHFLSISWNYKQILYFKQVKSLDLESKLVNKIFFLVFSRFKLDLQQIIPK